MSFQRVTATLETWCGPFKCYPCDPVGVNGYSNSLSGTSPMVYGRKSRAFLAGFRALDNKTPGYWRRVEGSGTLTLAETTERQDYDGEGNPVGDPYFATDTYSVTLGGVCEWDGQDVKQGHVTVDYAFNGSPGVWSSAHGIRTDPVYTHLEYQQAVALTLSTPIPFYIGQDHNPVLIYDGGGTALATPTSITTTADSATPYYSSGGTVGQSSGANGSTLSLPDTTADAWARAQARTGLDTWQSMANILTSLGLTFFGSWRLDALAEAGTGISGGDTFGQIARGKLGLQTAVNLGDAVRLRFALRKYALPVTWAEADHGDINPHGLYAQRNYTRVFTTEVDPDEDLMLHPIDTLGPLDMADSSWADAVWERASAGASGISPTLTWTLFSATWEDRSLATLSGNLTQASSNGWTQQSRFRVRRVERDASNVIVSDSEATFTTTFDPARAAPFSEQIQAVPTTRGNTVTFSVILWETRATADDPWSAVTSSLTSLTFFRARRQGSWGFQGAAPASGELPTYYRKTTYTATVTEVFTPATPPSPAESSSLGAAPVGLALTATYTATLTGPSIFTFGVAILGAIEGQPFEFTISVPGCSRRGVITAPLPGGFSPHGHSPIFPVDFDRVPYDLALTTGNGDVVPAFKEAWAIPLSPDPSQVITATMHQTTVVHAPADPIWHSYRVVGGATTPALLIASVEERICDKLPSGHAAGAGYLCADEDVWVPEDGELWLVPWFAFMPPAGA